MILKELKPRKALNKAFLKVKPLRAEIESFKLNLITLLDKINTVDARPTDESEEHLKNDIRDFLRDTYYRDSYAINTKDKKDLVIHTSKGTDSNVGVIIEAKRPSNKSEMITKENINKKAFQELVLYYLRERITNKNHDVQHLVITNINEWFIFDEHLFERLFASNKKFVKQFENFELGKKSTHVFYDEIAKPFIAEITAEIEFTYFNIQDYQQPLRNTNKNDDNTLIALFKLLSPEHLLKLPFTNDSNSLDKNFYNELLHLIGLTETKDGSKKIIDRLEPNQRNAGSLLENTINQLDSLDKLSRVSNIQQFGENNEQRLFNVGLELCITWVNRILFLKLLEAQLIAYHKGDKAYSFLNNGFVKDFDNMNSLFFMVLAKKHEERNNRVKDLFEKVPYLNSSLFEPTVLEHEALFISGLEDNITLPYLSNSVIKDINGKRRTGNNNALDYIFDFLNAYDFASEGTEDIQEDNKTLINASVLGLIFEKINGYKDGSFFTPGIITMYMCRETLRKAVVQKFNETKNWNCDSWDDLYEKVEFNKVEGRIEANAIVNSLKICDPAVGSGHFLVSALNEMIAIKNDLKILQDREGKRLKEYVAEVINDELIITDEEGDLFEYYPTNKELQRVQETLFHEKQTIIENCLFGVDINPNSVKICRLRLWIELLKSAYYKNSTELETLPNIDINIKCGNSLISRYSLDSDMKVALRNSKWSIENYKNAVHTYQNAEDKDQKKEMDRLITEIKSDLRKEIGQNSKEQKLLDKLSSEFYQKFTAPKLFEESLSSSEQKQIEKERKEKEEKLNKLKFTIEEIKNNRIFENAFEWRFEFPEVLNEDGDFIGFDAIIGNPPYFPLSTMNVEVQNYFINSNYQTFSKGSDIYCLFYELGINILKHKSPICYITSNRFCFTNYGIDLRKYISSKNIIKMINFNDVNVFENANVGSLILLVDNNPSSEDEIQLYDFKEKSIASPIDILMKEKSKMLSKNYFNENQWSFDTNDIQKIKSKIESKGIPFYKWSGLATNRGVTTGANKIFVIDTETKEKICLEDPNSLEIIKPILRGRDIKRYNLSWSGDWIIFTRRGVDIEKFPAIKNYLLPFRNELEPGIGRKAGKYKWFEIQDNTAFWAEFEKKKLIWTRLSNINGFSISENKEFCLDSASFAVTKDAEYLSAILNSKVVLFYFKLGSVIWGKDGIKWFGNYFDNIPIPVVSEEKQKPLIDLVNKILVLKDENQNSDTSAFEKEIDDLVYKLYELTDEEIQIIKEGV